MMSDYVNDQASKIYKERVKYGSLADSYNAREDEHNNRELEYNVRITEKMRINWVLPTNKHNTREDQHSVHELAYNGIILVNLSIILKGMNTIIREMKKICNLYAVILSYNNHWNEDNLKIIVPIRIIRISRLYAGIRAFVIK